MRAAWASQQIPRSTPGVPPYSRAIDAGNVHTLWQEQGNKKGQIF